MNFYEREMQRIFGGSDTLSSDTLFSGKVMVSNIGKDLRAKVEFISEKMADHYNGLKLSVISRTYGLVDSQIFLFRNIIGIKNNQEPYIWEYNGDASWYMVKPTVTDYENIREKVEEYIEMYSDQDMRYENSMIGGR